MDIRLTQRVLCSILLFFCYFQVAIGADNIPSKTSMKSSLSSLTLSENEQQVDLSNLPSRVNQKPLRKRSKKEGTLNFQATSQNILKYFSDRKITNKKGGKSPYSFVNLAKKNNKRKKNREARLNKDGKVKIHYNSKNGTPVYVKFKGKGPKLFETDTAQSGKSQADLAKQYVAANHAFFKLKNPSEEMRLLSKKKDRLNKTHLRFQQTYKNIPVWASEIVIHLDANDNLYLVQGRYHPTPVKLTNVVPTISAEDAKKSVRRDLNTPKAKIADAQSKLIIFPDESGSLVLAFEVTIKPSLDVNWTYFIDAHSGKVIQRMDNIRNAGSIVSASGQDLSGVTRTYNSWLESGTYYLIDPSTPLVDASYDPLNSGPNGSGDTFTLDAQNGDGGNLFYVSSNAQNSGWDTSGVSTAYNTRRVYDYYNQTFGRNSYDDAGKNLLSVIHYLQNYNNAFWNGTYMVFGDGDGVVFDPLAGCLDVVAHEMSHGVIEHTVNLMYQNQSGALNESLSDIFSAMVDRDDWLIGEDCTIINPGYLRNMANPALGITPQPTKMSEYQNRPNTEAGDYGGVHVNSGIPNRAAYLLAEGLTTESLGNSIGRSKTENIFYRTLEAQYLSPLSTFHDARLATIQASDDLYGVNSPESLAVATAWDSVEVTDDIVAPGDTTPTSTDPLSGSQWMAYLYPVTDTLFDLYVQVMPEPFTGYNPALDYGPFNGLSYATSTRPAVLTEVTETSIGYVGTDNNLYVINNSGEQKLTTTGDIHSIAASPDGRYFAYTSVSSNDNNLYVMDINTEVIVPYPLQTQEVDGNGNPISIVLYPDALDFDSTSQKIVFDYLSCVSIPVLGNCSSGGGYQYWSVGIINASNGNQTYPFPNQDPLFDLSFPSFAANNNFVIALDVQNYSDYDTNGGLIESAVVTFNFETQNPEFVAYYGFNSEAIFGVPSFWRLDNYITAQVPYINGVAGYRFAIDNNWAGAGLGELLNDYDVQYPIMHVDTAPVINAAWSVNTGTLNFGDVSIGQNKELTVTITNTGDRDIYITDINTNATVFTHNGANNILPRGISRDIKVTHTPNGTLGTQAGVLSFISDGEPSTLSVSLVGNALPAINNAPTISGAPSTSIAQDTSYSFTPISGDIDGDPLLFSITNKPSWANFNTATGALTGIPTNADVGTTVGVVITVDDQQSQPNSTASLAAFDIEVTNINDAPTISGMPTISIAQDASYSFTPIAGDIDGDPLLFSITNKPSWANFNTATGALTGIPINADVGTTLGVVITVDDQQSQLNSTASLAAFDIEVTSSIPDGDINSDGQVNAADLIIAKRILLGDYNPTAFEFFQLDVAPLVGGLPAPDGQINIGDYLILQRKVLGEISF